MCVYNLFDNENFHIIKKQTCKLNWTKKIRRGIKKMIFTHTAVEHMYYVNNRLALVTVVVHCEGQYDAQDYTDYDHRPKAVGQSAHHPHRVGVPVRLRDVTSSYVLLNLDMGEGGWKGRGGGKVIYYS